MSQINKVYLYTYSTNLTFFPTDTINQWFGKPQIVKKGLKWQIGKLVMTFYLLYLSFFGPMFIVHIFDIEFFFPI